MNRIVKSLWLDCFPVSLLAFIVHFCLPLVIFQGEKKLLTYGTTHYATAQQKQKDHFPVIDC